MRTPTLGRLIRSIAVLAVSALVAGSALAQKTRDRTGVYGAGARPTGLVQTGL